MEDIRFNVYFMGPAGIIKNEILLIIKRGIRWNYLPIDFWPVFTYNKEVA